MTSCVLVAFKDITLRKKNLDNHLLFLQVSGSYQTVGILLARTAIIILPGGNQAFEGK